MATYTFNTTDEQEALLTWIVAQANKQKDTKYSNAEYVQVRFPELLQPYAAAYKETLESALKSAFRAADPTTQATVLGLLRVTP